jgi:protein O-GlcNAc transferase
MGASFLHSLGREDWLAEDGEGGLTIAKSLASQVVALRQLRLSFRDQMTNSSLCDLDRYVIDFQRLFDRMWHRYESGGSDRIFACMD